MNLASNDHRTRISSPERPSKAASRWLALVLLLGACAREGSPSSPAALDAPRLAYAPALAELAGLDPVAAEALRRRAAELEENVERADAWTQLGAELHANSRFELARTCYEQRLLRDAEDARTWYWLALVEDELGASESEPAHLEQCLRLAPRYTPAHWRLGYLMLARGDLTRAERAMQAALDLAPHDAAAVVGMARVRLQQGEAAQAAALLEEHLRRLPRDENARFLLGTAYRALGRSADAERALTGGAGGEALREDPWQAEVLSRRQGYRTDFLHAVELLEKGALPAAIALLEALHAKKPTDTLVDVNLHRAYRKNGELERAIALLLEARGVDPFLDIVHLHLAGAYRDQARSGGGEPDRAALETALASGQTACELSPTFADAHGMRGDILGDLGRAPEALEAYLRAVELDPDSAMWNERAGMALCRAGRWQEAVPRLRRLNALQPRSARTLYHLAAALANSGQLDEAQAPLQEARALAPTDPVIQKALADLERSRLEARSTPAAGENGG